VKPLVACLVILLTTAPALADAALEPEEYDRFLRPRITGAGHACPGKITLETPTEQDRAYGQERNVRVYRVRCGDGRRYLISRSSWGQRQNPPPEFVVPIR